MEPAQAKWSSEPFREKSPQIRLVFWKILTVILVKLKTRDMAFLTNFRPRTRPAVASGAQVAQRTLQWCDGDFGARPQMGERAGQGLGGVPGRGRGAPDVNSAGTISVGGRLPRRPNQPKSSKILGHAHLTGTTRGLVTRDHVRETRRPRMHYRVGLDGWQEGYGASCGRRKGRLPEESQGNHTE